MTKAGYNSIWVIADKLTKFAYFLPFKEAVSASDLAYAFLRNIVAQHGLPKQIITDRAPVYASKFWQTLMKSVRTNYRLTTAYHPQTNGQVERMNQTLEQFLRAYINYEQNDWVQWLPIAQYAYNNGVYSATQVTPFYTNYGYNPEILYQLREGSLLGEERAEHLKGLQEKLSNNIAFLNSAMGKYYDKRREDTPPWKEGDKVFLIQRNIKSKRSSKKLDYIKKGPYRITKKLSKNTFKLELPNARIHPVFHTSLL